MIDWRHWHNEPYLVGGIVFLGWLWAVLAGPWRSRLLRRAGASAEAAAREPAADRKIAVIGGYDPRPFKLTAYDYLDERHLRPESIRRLEPAQNE